MTSDRKRTIHSNIGMKLRLAMSQFIHGSVHAMRLEDMKKIMKIESMKSKQYEY